MLRIILILAILSSSAYAKTVVVDEKLESIDLKPFTTMTHSNLLAIEKIPLDAEWKPLKKPLIRGIHEALWLRYEFDNISQKPLRLIYQSSTLADDALLFSCRERVCEQLSQWGTQHPEMNVESDQVSVRIPLVLEPGKTTLIFRMISGSQYGLDDPKLLTRAKAMEIKQETDLIAGTILGCLLALMFYNLLQLVRFYDKIQLVYVGFLVASVFNFEMVYRVISNFMESRYFYELGLIPNLLSINVAAIFALGFNVMAIDLKKNDRIFFYISLPIGLIFLLNIIYTLLPGNSHFLLAQWNVTYLGGFIYDIFAVTVLIRACLRGYRPAYFYLLALSFALAGIVTQILALNAIIDNSTIMTFTLYIGICLEMIFLSLGIADKHSLEQQQHLTQIGELNSSLSDSNVSLENSNRELLLAQKDLKAKNAEIEEMNRNLEDIVDERTRELRTVFHNIPQGVATIDAEGRISAFYSEHLEDIWQQKNLGGRLFLEFLESTGLSSDQLNRVSETLKVVVGEDELNFEANSIHFPSKLETKEPVRYLDLTWNPELDEQMVSRVLVTIVDNTIRHHAELEAKDQKEHLSIIGELVSCSEKKLSIFFRTSKALFEESRKIFQTSPLSVDDIKALFVHAHTVKGGARTLGLENLSTEIHELEQLYTRAFSEPGLELKESFEQVGNLMDKYAHCNFELLGRDSNDQEIKVNRDALKDMLSVVGELLEKGTTEFIDIEPRLRSLRSEFFSYFAQTDRGIFESLANEAIDLSKELGKAVTRVEICASDTVVDQRISDILSQCMVHMLRNSLDHGIEMPEERRDKNKPLGGLISIESKNLDGNLHVRVEDDGRGLAIAKLRKMGLEKGLISEGASLNEISELIFYSGTSTAERVSQISGRGVGMDAVRRFLEQAGGSIDIELKSVEQDAEYISIAFLIKLPCEQIKLAS